MNHTRTMLKGTLILTLSGFLTKIIGFLYRIFLSQTIGSTGMGIYQLIFPIHALCFALTVGGIQTAISRLVAGKNFVRLALISAFVLKDVTNIHAIGYIMIREKIVKNISIIT